MPATQCCFLPRCWLGLVALPWIVLLAACAGLFDALVLRLAGRRIDASTALPFGPWLALAIWLLWLLGDGVLTLNVTRSWPGAVAHAHRARPPEPEFGACPGAGVPLAECGAGDGTRARRPSRLRSTRAIADYTNPLSGSAHRALRSVSVDHVVRHTALRQPDAGHL